MSGIFINGVSNYENSYKNCCEAQSIRNIAGKKICQNFR